MSNHLDATRIVYDDDAEKRMYAERNAALIAAINAGTPFKVVRLSHNYRNCFNYYDLCFALVKTADGVIPWPLFEDAGGMQETIESLFPNVMQDQIHESELDAVLRPIWGPQFQGIEE